MWGWGFGWMFWIIPLAVFGFFRRGPRSDRWARRIDRQDPALLDELEDQRAYAEALESRVAQLEERLDFAERLLAGRREMPIES